MRLQSPTSLTKLPIEQGPDSRADQVPHVADEKPQAASRDSIGRSRPTTASNAGRASFAAVAMTLLAAQSAEARFSRSRDVALAATDRYAAPKLLPQAEAFAAPAPHVRRLEEIALRPAPIGSALRRALDGAPAPAPTAARAAAPAPGLSRTSAPAPGPLTRSVAEAVAAARTSTVHNNPTVFYAPRTPARPQGGTTTDPNAGRSVPSGGARGGFGGSGAATGSSS